MRVRDARLLARLLAYPAAAGEVRDWTSMLSLARAESLLGSLAFRLDGLELPEKVERLLAAARRDSEQVRTAALWEAEMARRALAPLGVPVILLKGTAYAAAGLAAACGRSIGDLDILVPREALPEVERALLAAGWEWVKEDAYDDLYYRRWMHELPPLIHKERDRMIDVHHTILPLTARPRPDPEAMIRDSVELANGLRVLSPADMVVHSVAHLFADGDLSGGLRNLWDVNCLLEEFFPDDVADGGEGWDRLSARFELHGLTRAFKPANALTAHFFGGYGAPAWTSVGLRLCKRRLLARDGWGRSTRHMLRLGFYIRSHWLRMPPLMLARHLWAKARKR